MRPEEGFQLLQCILINTTLTTGDVMQIEGIHTAEPLVLDPSPFEAEIAIAKL
jgi:hypothetical protein